MEIQPVHPKGDQSWVFIWRTDAEAETPILWPPDAKSWFIWKDPDAGKDRRQEKGTTQDEMVGWYHWLNAVSLGELWELVMDRSPGVLWFMGSQRVGHDWVTELNWKLAFKGTSWLVLLYCLTCQALKWPPWLGSFIRHLTPLPPQLGFFSISWCVSISWPVWGLSLLVSRCCWHVGRDVTVMAPPSLCTSAVLTKGIFHCDLPSYIPMGCLPTVNSRLCPGVALQFLGLSS